jgi:hypothetical protein
MRSPSPLRSKALRPDGNGRLVVLWPGCLYYISINPIGTSGPWFAFPPSVQLGAPFPGPVRHRVVGPSTMILRIPGRLVRMGRSLLTSRGLSSTRICVGAASDWSDPGLYAETRKAIDEASTLHPVRATASRPHSFLRPSDPIPPPAVRVQGRVLPQARAGGGLQT